MHTHLNDIQQRFAEDGFFVLRNALDPDQLAHLRGWLAQQADQARMLADTARLKKLEELSATEKALITGNFPVSTKADLTLWEPLIHSTALRQALQALLGSTRIYGHMYPSPRYIDPGNDIAGVPTHLDRQYNAHMSNFITVWVPIECFSADIGGVIVYPGTHKSAVAWAETKKMASGFWFEPVAEPTEGQLQVLAPGDVLLIHPDLLHKSSLNKSEKTRLSCDFRIFGDSDFTQKHYLEFDTQRICEPYQGERHAEKV